MEGITCPECEGENLRDRCVVCGGTGVVYPPEPDFESIMESRAWDRADREMCRADMLHYNYP